MNKIKIIFLLFTFIIVSVFIKFNNDIVSQYILTKLSKWTERTVTAESVNIEYFKGIINLNGLKILNKPNFYDENIFETKKLTIEIELSSIFSDLVKINRFILYQPRFFFEIRDVTEKKENLKSSDLEIIFKDLKQLFKKRGFIINWKALEEQNLDETINALAMASPFSLEEKQVLLETINLDIRKNKIAEILSTYTFDGYDNTTLQ